MPSRSVPPGPWLLAALALAAAGPAAPAGGSGTNDTGYWSAGETSLRVAVESPETTGAARVSGAGAARGRAYRLTTRGGERAVELPRDVQVEELFGLRQGAFLSARGTDRGLYLALIDREGLHALPAPPLRARRVRENAVPLTSSGGDLTGLAWLEGTDRQSYAVLYAGWDTLRWSEPEVIADEAPGSQLALAGAALDDGSRLLVWSRFDGQDDEIVAARFENGRWGAARPIAEDNAVPDITPAVVAVPGGALAAWSRYDGHDYRVVIARFDGREWSSPAWAGPAGSTAPYLTPVTPATPAALGGTGGTAGAGVRAAAGTASTRTSPGRPATWLSFSTVQPRGWGVLELDATGKVLRRGSAANTPAARPALEPLPSGEVRLRWAALASDVELH